MKRTLFVWSGGGCPGLCIHGGLWQALSERGIVATTHSGTSAGACVAAFAASGWNAGVYNAVIRTISDSDILHKRPLWKCRIPWLTSIHDNDRIALLLQRLLSDSFPIGERLYTWAIRRTNCEKINTARPAVSPALWQSVLASMAVPVLLPPVNLMDGQYVDGGQRFNLPLLPDWREYDAVYLLIGQRRWEDYPDDGNLITSAVRAFEILQRDQILDVLDETSGAANVHVLWPRDLKSTAGMLHLDHSLIDAAYRYAVKELEAIHGQTA